ncbi:MAG: hypothetical protein ACXWZY_05535 [Gaiellaceae bacterium]
MPYRSLNAVLVLLAALVLVGAAYAFPSGTAATRATLKLVRTEPVLLSGSGFRSAERVRVSAQIDGKTLVRRVVASRVGAFRVAFGTDIVVDRCNSPFAARAVGARGSEARLKLPELLCPPALP